MLASMSLQSDEISPCGHAPHVLLTLGRRHYINKTEHQDFDPLGRTGSILSAAAYDQMIVLVRPSNQDYRSSKLIRHKRGTLVLPLFCFCCLLQTTCCAPGCAFAPASALPTSMQTLLWTGEGRAPARRAVATRQLQDTLQQGQEEGGGSQAAGEV